MASDLSIQFGNILEQPTLFPQEQGKLNVVVKNQGDSQISGPINLKLYASTDNVLDNSSLEPLDTLGPRGASDPLQGVDELLGSLNNQTVNLAPGQSRTFTVDFAGSDFRTASVVSPGVYYLIGQVEPGNNVTDSNAANNVASQLITQGDAVIQWNSIFLNAVQLSGNRRFTEGSQTPQGTSPPLVARDLAILNTAIYDAVNSINRTHQPYLVNNISASEAAGASKDAAVVEAAYRTLFSVFTDSRYSPPDVFGNRPSPAIIDALKATFNEQRDRSLAAIPNGDAKTKGIAIGDKVADQILAARVNDGAATAQGPYTPGTGFGDWQPTPPDFKPALLPQWGNVTPFAIPSASRFRPDTEPEYVSPRYTRDFNEVKAIGKDNSTVRNADQTEIAQFWAYQRPDTFGAVGQLVEATQEVALAKGNTLEQNARLFALLGIAEADAGIVTWNAKYTYEELRPITAIRNADQDNNPDTIADKNWNPLLSTPNFPDYISGHSAFAGATAEVLRSFYGTDNISFDIPSQDLPGVARAYGSFTQFAQEDAISRVYGGVHIDTAAVDGVSVGGNVGNFVVNNSLI